MEITDQESAIVRGGLAAADLLANEAFASTVKALAIECFAQFTESKPQDAASREDTYNLYRGLKAIEAELQSRVSAKDEIERRLNASYEDDQNLGD